MRGVGVEERDLGMVVQIDQNICEQLAQRGVDNDGAQGRVRGVLVLSVPAAAQTPTRSRTCG